MPHPNNTVVPTFLAIAALTLSALPAQAASPTKTYTNARFGFVLDYPQAWGDPEESANGDGAHVLEPSGAKLTMSGWRLDSDSLQTLFERDSKDDPARARSVTYKVMKADWYVVSGYEASSVFYRKVIVHPAEDRQASFTLTFPKARKTQFDPIIPELAKSLRFANRNARLTDSSTPTTPPKAPIRGAHLNLKVRTHGMPGVRYVRLENRDSFDWHHVRVCVNERWCLDHPVLEPCHSKDCLDASDGGHSFIWYMTPDSEGRTSEFRDSRNVSNHDNAIVETIDLTADEGTQRVTF